MTDGLAIIARLIAAYGQSDGDGSAYLLELKSISFLTEGNVAMFSNKFKRIYTNDFNTTGTHIPSGIQRAALLEALRTRDSHSLDGNRLVARAPEALALLRQTFMSQKLNAETILNRLEITCESIVTTDPIALDPDTDSSALVLAHLEHTT